jgi:RNA polymerase sigma-70 factor (ECF subfamily)
MTESPSENSIVLLHRYQAGDASARDALYRRYWTRLRRWAGGRLPLRARGVLDTDDVVQNAMMKTLGHLSSFEPHHSGALHRYFRQAVLNCLRDEIRKHGVLPEITELSGEETGTLPSPLDDILGRELARSYETALSSLRDEEQEAIIMRVEQGYDYEEIALELGKPSADAARMAVSRALIRLARKMRHVLRA